MSQTNLDHSFLSAKRNARCASVASLFVQIMSQLYFQADGASSRIASWIELLYNKKGDFKAQTDLDVLLLMCKTSSIFCGGDRNLSQKVLKTLVPEI